MPDDEGGAVDGETSRMDAIPRFCGARTVDDNERRGGFRPRFAHGPVHSQDTTEIVKIELTRAAGTRC